MGVAADGASSHAASSSLSAADLVSFLRAHLIVLFFALLGVGSVCWLVGFNLVWSKAHVLRAIRSLGVAKARAIRAFAELKRKSFHLVGALVPAIYWLGLRFGEGRLTKHGALYLLGAPTAFLWLVELLRWVSPSFRAHYNRLFACIMRKQELVALAANEACGAPLTEGTVLHSVDLLVAGLAKPILGELDVPITTSPRNATAATGPSLRVHAVTTAAAATAAAAADAVKRAGSKPLAPTVQDDYSKVSRSGPVPLPAAAPSPRNGSGSPRAAGSGSEKVFTGTGFYFLGCWLAMLLFPPTIATCAMLFLVLGDMSAAMVGISFGCTCFSYRIGKKSLEGTIAMFLVCMLVGCVFFASHPHCLPVVATAALAATLVELLGPERWYTDDNITIPLTTGFAFTFAFSFFTGGLPEDM